MRSAAGNPEEYFSHLSEERRAVLEKLRAVLKDNLPEGIEETMTYGMIGYIIPHRL